MLKARLYSSFLLSLAAAAALSACGASNVNNEISKEPERSGSSLEAVSVKYNDVAPSISDDGTKVVFISGRDGNDQSPTLKAYKADWTAGAAPGGLARVTASDIGYEKAALLSPGSSAGVWIALLATNAGQTDIYLQDYAGAKAAQKVTNDAAVESDLSFSPDGKLLAWISKTGTAATAMLVEIGDGSADALKNVVKASADGDVVRQIFWIPAASGYVLATGVAASKDNDLSVTYSQRAFATAADAAAATATEWVKGFPWAPGVQPAAATSQAVLVRKDRASDGILVLRIGDAPDATATLPVVSEPLLVATTPGAQPQAYKTIPGFETLTTEFATDGATAFYLTRSWYFCDKDPAESFGAALTVSPSDPAAGVSYVMPRLAGPDSWELASGPCDRARADGSKGRIDDKLTDIAVARTASAEKFRAAYVTRFTPHFDTNCNLRAGDPEIMVLDIDGATKKIYPLSKNPAPLTDDERSGDPCVL